MPPAWLEHATYGLGNRRSIQLSYGSIVSQERSIPAKGRRCHRFSPHREMEELSFRSGLQPGRIAAVSNATFRVRRSHTPCQERALPG